MGDTSLPLGGYFLHPPSPRHDGDPVPRGCCERRCLRGAVARCLCPCRRRDAVRSHDHRAPHHDAHEDDLRQLLEEQHRPRPHIRKPDALRRPMAYAFAVAVWLVVAVLYATFVFFNMVPALTRRALTGAREDDLGLRPPELWAEVVALHLFLALFAVSFFYAMLLPPGSPDERWRWKDGTTYPDFLEHVPPVVRNADLCRELKVFRPQKTMTEERRLEQLEEKRMNVLRYRHCWHCRVFKPDRTHHCSQLKRCVLRMDHYCPWVNNTLGFDNMKFFILTLFYGTHALVVYLVAMGARFLQAIHLRSPGSDWVVLVVYPLAVFLFVAVTWFFGFHCHLLVEGYTTVEWCEKRAMTADASAGDIVLDETADADGCGGDDVDDDSSGDVDAGDDADGDGRAEEEEEGGKGHARKKQQQKKKKRRRTTKKRTVVEASSLYHDSPWKVSLLENVQQVLGQNFWLWLVPVSQCCHSFPGGAHGRSGHSGGDDRGRLYNDSHRGRSPFAQGIDFPRNAKHQLYSLRRRLLRHFALRQAAAGQP